MQKINETAVEKLNRMYGEYLALPCLPVEVVMGKQPVTLARSTDDAFTLNTAIDVHTKNINNVIETEADQGIIRATIGLAAASRMIDDLGYGYFYLAVLKNEMLSEMAKFFNLSNHKVVWNRAGKSNEYFIDFDNVAGYEVRCYIVKTKVSK
jgi:hypothetical protein